MFVLGSIINGVKIVTSAKRSFMCLAYLGLFFGTKLGKSGSAHRFVSNYSTYESDKYCVVFRFYSAVSFYEDPSEKVEHC